MADAFSKIDKILYLNLDHRTDRKEHLEKELCKMKISPEKIVRIPAIQHPRGAVGCTMTQIKALKYAIEQDYNNCLILEDDFTFRHSYEKTNNLLEQLLETSNWDVLLLAGNRFITKRIKGDVFRATDSQTASGYLVSKKYYKTLLDNFEKGLEQFITSRNPGRHAIDMYWKTLQKKEPWFITVPPIGFQYANYSDIEKRNVNYNA